MRAAGHSSFRREHPFLDLNTRFTLRRSLSHGGRAAGRLRLCCLRVRLFMGAVVTDIRVLVSPLLCSEEASTRDKEEEEDRSLTTTAE